ncbi:polymorphic toxin type 34 domain-containing protein, partial [Escherichia coli]|nr:polymorphic toxin type 34 domain-containing protein [Escherichia coli]
RAYCLKTQPATGETYPKSDLFNKASLILNNPGLALDITMIASRGNVADTGITDRVNDIINDRFWSDGKKPDRCDVLQELIDCGDISAKDAKSTQKAWNCRHSRQSNDKKR